MSDIATRFWDALAQILGGDSGDLFPTNLARAGVAIVAADGLGLSVLDDRCRVPLGANNSDAIAAERLQFTVGEGPCLQAVHDQAEVRFGEPDLARRWPAFYDELVRLTPYRSIASLPLRVTPVLNGAIDLYFIDPKGAYTVDLRAAAVVSDEIVTALRATSTPTLPSTRVPDVQVPAWLYSPAAKGRLRTWIAAGVVISHLGLAPADALARIRGYAYARQQDIADVTDSIISGALPADALAL